MDSQQVRNYLGNAIYKYFGNRPVTSTNYHRVGTTEQYIDFCRQNWSYLQYLNPNLIDESELDERLKQVEEPWTQWDFYSLVLGDTNMYLEKTYE